MRIKESGESASAIEVFRQIPYTFDEITSEDFREPRTRNTTKTLIL